MATVSAGPALECDDCGYIGVSEADIRKSNGECPLCGEPVVVGDITDCPSETDDCDDELHDFGIDKHWNRRDG